MAPHFDRHADASAEQNDLHSASVGSVDEAAMDDAAEALREVEVEAAQPEPEIADVSTLDAVRLESMNIDELRVRCEGARRSRPRNDH